METSDWIGDASRIERDREYVALLTRVPPDLVPTTARYLRYVTALRSRLGGARGLVGHAFRADIVKREYWTLSVWTDEEACRRFAYGRGNGDGAGGLREDAPAATPPAWRITGERIPPSWSEARTRLGEGAR